MYKDSRKNKFEKNGVPKVIKDDRRKPEFPEDLMQIPGLSPLAQTTCGFDYAAVSRALGEKPDENDLTAVASVLRELLAWITRDCAAGRWDLRIVGRRAAALAWVVNPQIFDDVPIEKIAKFVGLPVSKISSRINSNCNVTRLVETGVTERTLNDSLPTFPG